jgi:two-component system sensor histidine kinase UhpB
MKNWLYPSRWSIAARLVLIATAPLLLMFIALSTTVYTTGKRDATAAATVHGEVLAEALAETCRFGVISGNTDVLELSARRFLNSDPAVASIQILDEHRKQLLFIKSAASRSGLVFERPIASEVSDVDVFTGGAAHSSGDEDARSGFRPGPPAGYVRVQMSAAPILYAQVQRMWLAGGVMLVAFVISVSVGLYLARVIRKPFTRVLLALRDIRQGRLDVHFGAHPSGDMGELQCAIEEMAQGLAAKRQELEAEVASRTRELEAAIAKAAEVDKQRRRLLAHSQEAVEEERRRIAIELHDQFNASLLAVKMRAAALFSRGGRLPPQPEVETIASNITEFVDQLYRDARAIVSRLRPEILDTMGLRGAISEGVRIFNRGETGCSLSLDVDDELPPLPDKLAIATYRVFQEALNNIVKHSGATRGVISVHHDAGVIEMNIIDNGRGFDVTEHSSGFGLLGMRERVDAFGGQLEIDSRKGDGARIHVRLPVRGSD